MVMTERLPVQRRTPARIVRKEQVQAQQDIFNENELAALIKGSKYHELFDLLGHSKTPFSNIITRSRNPDVDHERAWEESRGAIVHIYPDALDPEKYNPTVVKNAYITERERFIRTLKDPKGFRTEEIQANYRIGRSRAFRQIDDENDFSRHEILSQVLFSEGFFQK